MQIGRITGLTEPYDWNETSDSSLSLTFDYQSSGTSDGLLKRDALLSYPTPDEPVIPIISTSEPRRTGFYRPTRSQILSNQMVRVRGHLFGVQMDLERVSGFAQPTLEMPVISALLANAVSAVATDAYGFVAVPLSATEFYPGFANGSFPNRNSSDGAIICAITNTTGLVNGTAHFYVTPANFYVGAARLTQGGVPVVGRTLVQSDVTNWQLSNGIVQVSPNATAGKLDVAHWIPNSFMAAKTYKISGSIGVVDSFTALTVLRNSPEEVVIRLACTLASAGGVGQRVYLDIGVRRGDVLARCFISCDTSQAWQIARNSTEAAATIALPSGPTAGAIKANVADAAGAKYVLASYGQATTNDLTNGKITLSSAATTFDFGIGSDLAGTGGGITTPQNVAQQYLAAQTEQQRVVAR